MSVAFETAGRLCAPEEFKCSYLQKIFFSILQYSSTDMHGSLNQKNSSKYLYSQSVLDFQQVSLRHSNQDNWYGLKKKI